MDPLKIQTVSKAAYGLCCWLGAMEKYDKAIKIVAPKQQALRVAEAEYKEVMDNLAQKQAALKQVVTSVTSFLTIRGRCLHQKYPS